MNYYDKKKHAAVTVFKHSNCQGAFKRFFVDEDETIDRTDVDGFDHYDEQLDQMISIMIPKGFKVELFDDDNRNTTLAGLDLPKEKHKLLCQEIPEGLAGENSSQLSIFRDEEEFEEIEFEDDEETAEEEKEKKAGRAIAAIIVAIPCCCC